jgi:hypothetical protein
MGKRANSSITSYTSREVRKGEKHYSRVSVQQSAREMVDGGGMMLIFADE